MPDSDQFIERQAIFQFGKCAAPTGLDLRRLVLQEAPNRLSLALHDAHGGFLPAERGAGVIRDRDGWHTHFDDTTVPRGKKLKAGRKADVLSDLYALGLCAPVLMDMHDAVRSPNEFPIFQYNRRLDALNSILWPLERVHEIGSKHFVGWPDPEEPPLSQKESRVFWRGSLRGFSTYQNSNRNIIGVIKGHTAGRISSKDLLRHLETVPRYIFVSRYFETPGFDIGFSEQKDKPYVTEVPEISRFVRPYVPPAEQLACKFLVSVSGTDVASSFGWQINTNAVILRERYPWEVFFDCHFRAWEHFVPIAPDFSDLPEKIAWCEDNPDRCQRMVDMRHSIIPLLLDEKARQEVLRRVVQRYNEFYLRGRYVPPAALR